MVKNYFEHRMLVKPVCFILVLIDNNNVFTSKRLNILGKFSCVCVCVFKIFSVLPDTSFPSILYVSQIAKPALRQLIGQLV